MTIYVQNRFTTGKDFPISPNQKFGRAPGKAGAIATAIQIGYGYFRKHRNILTGIGAIGVGTVSTGVLEINESPSFFPKTLRATHSVYRRKCDCNRLRRNPRYADPKCKHICGSRRRKRNQGRVRRVMATY